MRKLLVFQHIDREHPSNIANYAHERGLGLDIVRLWENPPVPNASNYDAIVVMGGSMGVYEEYAGKGAEIAALKENVGTIPILGVCLGSQLLAYALGSKVYQHMKDGKRVKEVGYGVVDFTDAGKKSPLFKGLQSPLTVLQWHGDTFDLPTGAELLATSPLCENQAFAVGNAYGLQFHIEVTPELVKEWVADDKAWTHTEHEMNDERVVTDSEKLAEMMKMQCYTLMDNFLSA